MQEKSRPLKWDRPVFMVAGGDLNLSANVRLIAA